MKARVDIEIYERWIAVFFSFHGIRGYYRKRSICEKSKNALYDQIRRCFRDLTDMYLEEITWEKRVKFEVKNKKYDLLIEDEKYDRIHSADSIFKEDDERIGELWRQKSQYIFNYPF